MKTHGIVSLRRYVSGPDGVITDVYMVPEDEGQVAIDGTLVAVRSNPKRTLRIRDADGKVVMRIKGRFGFVEGG